MKIFNPEIVTLYLSLGFFLWLFLGSITELLLPLDSLKKISGTVSDVEHRTFEYRSSRGSSGTYKSVSVWLKGNQSSFAVTGVDIDTGTFECLETGDEIDLYTKHWYQLPFLKRANEIYHLQRGHSVLFDINSRKKGNRMQLICSSFFMMVLSFVLVKYSRDKNYGW